MINYFRDNKVIVTALVIESYRLIFSDIDDYELFFFFWGFIGLFLLIASILNSKLNVGSGLGGFNVINNHVNNEAAASEVLHGKSNVNKRTGGLFNMNNWVYFIFFILNVIGYMIVLPN